MDPTFLIPRALPVPHQHHPLRNLDWREGSGGVELRAQSSLFLGFRRRLVDLLEARRRSDCDGARVGSGVCGEASVEKKMGCCAKHLGVFFFFFFLFVVFALKSGWGFLCGDRCFRYRLPAVHAISVSKTEGKI